MGSSVVRSRPALADSYIKLPTIGPRFLIHELLNSMLREENTRRHPSIYVNSRRPLASESSETTYLAESFQNLIRYVNLGTGERMPTARSKRKSEIYPTDSNRLVSALSAEDREFFTSKSAIINLPVGKVLMESGDPIEFAYFPTKGVISMVTLMFSGSGAEVGLIGTEGMVGCNALLGEKRMSHQALVQGVGDAYKIPIGDLLRLCERSQEAHLLCLRYTNSFLCFVSLSAACNALHSAESRMARWILLVQDRLHGAVLPITHEFLANMLGIRRATVTVVANALEKAGLIALGRREIKVVDHDGLAAYSCECYRAMSEATARVS